MRTEDFAYFLLVAKTHSLNKASKKLNVTYQTINTGIKNLEAELNVTLLERDSQGTFLTENGKIAEAYAINILKEANELKEIFANRQSGITAKKHGQLVVGVTPTINNVFMPDFVNKFHHIYSHITLSIKEYENEEILEKMELNQIDVGIFFSQTPERLFNEKHFNFEYKYSVKNRMQAYMASNHILAKRKSLSWKTTLDYPLAIYRAPSEASELENWLIAHGVRKSFP